MLVNCIAFFPRPVRQLSPAQVASANAFGGDRLANLTYLDQTQVVSFMIAIVVVCLAGAWKWLQGWQQHELLVAQRLAAPIKAVISTVQTGPPA